MGQEVSGMAQLVRVAPLRAANIVGLLHLVGFGAFALVLVPFVAAIPIDPKMDPQQQHAMRAAFRWMLMAYPFLSAVMGWLVALLGAAAYNLIAARIGGFELELREQVGAADASA